MPLPPDPPKRESKFPSPPGSFRLGGAAACRRRTCLPMGAAACLAFCLAACSPQAPAAPVPQARAPGQATTPPAADPRLVRARAALEACPFEVAEKAAIGARIEAAPASFMADLATLEAIAAADPDRFRLVDKVALPLDAAWAPGDLAPLDGSGLRLSRSGMELRRGALAALLALDREARAAGIRLEVGSAYRSYAYQQGVWDRAVAADGIEDTERSVAPPGRSQHQLGTALDFSPIDESFGPTPASAWLLGNAGRLGWSLSYAPGREAETGFRPESWHWRWLGPEAAAFSDVWFDGAQGRLLSFLGALRGIPPGGGLGTK